MSSYTPNLQLFKYNTSTDGKEVFSIEQALNHNWDILDQNSGSRNIGEIVASTIPLTDAGLHLLDGSLLQYGSYKAFIDYIAGLVSSYPDLFVSESDWQDSITSYGVCGKFVYDSTNNTVRLPKITGKLDGTTDANSLGDLLDQYIKLPNITGRFLGNEWPGYSRTQGAFYNSGTDTKGSEGGDSRTLVYFDASRCSSIYSGNGSDTSIHERAINVLYYIVIATSAKTQIQVDIDSIATDLNCKADVDLTNVNNSGASRGAGWAMPSNTYEELTLGANGASYIAPANGWFNIQAQSSSATGFIILDGGKACNGCTANSGRWAIASSSAVCKNDTIVLYYGNISTSTFRFYYAQGSESEA